MPEDGLYRTLRQGGFSGDDTKCMVRELKGAIPQEKISDLVYFASWSRWPKSKTDALYKLMQIDDKQTRAALAAAGARCLTGVH